MTKNIKKILVVLVPFLLGRVLPNRERYADKKLLYSLNESCFIEFNVR